MRQLRDLLSEVRRNPMTVRAPGGDGEVHTVTITAEALNAVAFNSTYASTTYVEFAAAVRSALAGDALPLGRLIAEYDYSGPDDSTVAQYSPGLMAAVSCMDYPQMFDLRATPAERRLQYQRAVAAMEERQPGIYAPFTIREYLRSGWAAPQMCLEWPTPNVPFGPPRPTSGSYPRIPTLVLSGELDSITTAAEGDLVAAQFPGARHIIVANTTHVTAGEGTASCGARLVRRMIRTAKAATVVDDCSSRVRALPTLGRFPVTLSEVAPGSGWRAVAAAAAATAADARRRLAQAGADSGAGLRGGRWLWRGGLELRSVRLVRDLPVSGRVIRDGDRIIATLTAPGVDRIRAIWPDPRSAIASVRVRVGEDLHILTVTIG